MGPSLSLPHYFLLLALISFTVVINAAECCGWRSHEWNEDQLWNVRARLCNNPYGQERSANGFIAKGQVWTGNSLSEYAFWMRDGSSSDCWHATQEMIEQCFRGGSGAGSWEHNGQLYTMSATTLGQYKRNEIDNGTTAPSVDHLPILPPTTSGTLDSLKLANGTYNIHGRPVRVVISGIILNGQQSSHPTRSESQLITNSGPMSNFTVIAEQHIDLEAAITSIVDSVAGDGSNATKRGRNPVTKRGQTCKSNGNYVMLEYGQWWPGFKLASGLYKCGQCTHTASWSSTTSESFSIGINGGLAGKIANTAWTFGYAWERSHTVGTSKACPWTQGGCHTVWTEQPMVFQGGFALDAWAWNEWQTEVRIRWVHSDAPSGDDSIDCNRGCCSGAVKSSAGTWENCHWAKSSDVCWYGTCTNWDHNCNGVGWC